MRIFEIPDDSGFLGIVNYDEYNSFISEDWEFEDMKKRIIEEINSNHLMFWATGFGNNWKVGIYHSTPNKSSFKELKGIIKITNQKLFLTNFESLTMAAQFEDVILPEAHMQDLFITLDNGIYDISIRQMFNPNEFDFDSDEVNFEIVLIKSNNQSEIEKDKINEIYWSVY